MTKQFETDEVKFLSKQSEDYSLVASSSKMVAFVSDDQKEILRLASADKMASCLFDIAFNVWRHFKHTDYDYDPYHQKIWECLKEHDIDPDELIE